MMVQDNLEREKEWSQQDQLGDYYRNAARHGHDRGQGCAECA